MNNNIIALRIRKQRLFVPDLYTVSLKAVGTQYFCLITLAKVATFQFSYFFSTVAFLDEPQIKFKYHLPPRLKSDAALLWEI